MERKLDATAKRSSYGLRVGLGSCDLGSDVGLGSFVGLGSDVGLVSFVGLGSDVGLDSFVGLGVGLISCVGTGCVGMDICVGAGVEVGSGP